MKEKIIELITSETPVVAAEKIIRLIDEEKKENNSDEIVGQIMQPSAILSFVLCRTDWSLPQLKDEAAVFVALNYPQGGDIDQIRKHFFNYIKKRKPNGKSSRTANASQW